MAGIELISSAFNDHAVLARRYAYEGENESPPLAWSAILDEATELVLVEHRVCHGSQAQSGPALGRVTGQHHEGGPLRRLDEGRGR